ncbi:C2 domain-containing protein 5-like isoform X2 [Dreissena polymorpha]|uniref:C2 domain-containing protein 5-like isoform X2 n=1 Tax=Dreissena polymorpha TaxID=45954 RepID=UPI002264BFB6|nr:C2 domain-containing protein 5-like isoform X2 [Dreissena polymorpha]
MPGTLKVKIVAARDLPVMDRSTDLTDAFVEIKMGTELQKTEVFKRSLYPQWNSDWFKFEVEDEVLQDEPLELRVLDHDTYSAHDAIGKVYIDLNPLLVKESPSVISGWFPVYDTMHGIRGDLNVIVKIDLFSDFNKFRQSSCGIQFFCTAEVPAGYRLQYVHGFVEELVVNDDPEYQWIDKIRTPRSSNEARQRLFSKMSGQLTRKIGLKVLEMGGGAVIGFKQCFDLEGESGIVIRGIGTAVTLAKARDPPVSPLGMSPLKDSQRPLLPALHISMPIVMSTNSNPLQARRSLNAPHLPITPPHHTSNLAFEHHHSFQLEHTHSACLPRQSSSGHTPPQTAPPHIGIGPPSSASHFAFDFAYSSPVPEESNAPSSPQSKNELSSTSPMKMNGTGTRHSSGSDASTPPKGNFLDCSSGSGSGKNFPKICSQQINIELMEFPLFTMTSFPPGFILHLGGVVAARSVKLLDKIHNPEEPETRDAWWNEIRTEIRSHTRAMGCHAVIGYSEETSICDDIILLSAMGTAAKVNLNLDQYQSTRLAPPQVVNTGDRSNMSAERDQSKKLYVDVNLANQVSHRLGLDESSPRYNCALCHIPYKPSSSPFPINLTQCACCRRRYVPDLLFTTINRPPEIHTVGHGAFIQARVCRPKGDGKTEVNAKEISDILPFMEYELHNQLVVKLKIRSMNCLFGLKMQFVVGESMLIGIATGTGVFLSPLPAPPVPRLVGQVTSEEENVELQELQLQIQEKLQRHKDLYNLNSVVRLLTSRKEISNQNLTSGVQTDDSDDDTSDLDLSAGNKDTFILEVDDTKDNSVKAMLSDVLQPPGMYVCNTDTYPGLTSQNLASNLQMFTQVFRRTVDNLQGLNKDFSEFFDSVFRRLFFKLRRMIPCCLCNVSFAVGAPEENQIEIVVTGICVRVDDSTSQNNSLTDNPMPMHGLETPMTGASSKSLLKPVSNVVGASGENVDEMMFPMEEVTEGSGASANKAARLKVVSNSRNTSQVFSRTFHGIEVTPLAYVPGARIERYIGSYNFFFIRETSSVKEVGGVCGFMQKFITEVLAIVRAHVSSLGGNALVAYNMTQCVLLSNEHKNQSQCLINVCGDAVFASREGEITAVVPDLIHSRKPSDSPSFAT